MKIALCGVNKNKVLNDIEKYLGVTAIKPNWTSSDPGDIIDYAAVTYKYANSANVLFDGSAFDFLTESCEGYDEVFEQIALSTLINLDKVIVITSGLNPTLLKSYKYFADICPNKFQLLETEDDFNILTI